MSSRFRRDTFTVNEHGQTVWSAKWIGGPSISCVHGAVCQDGVKRVAYVTSSEPSTMWSIPASVSVKGKTVGGSLICDSDEPYRFVANRSGVNAGLIVPVVPVTPTTPTAEDLVAKAGFESAKADVERGAVVYFR